MRGRCKASPDGFHEPTIIGDPHSEMTYYKCMGCGAYQPRGQGAFFGRKKLTTPSIQERKGDGMKTGWLIEKEDKKNPGHVTGICLGECNGALKWTTPNLAIRFARKEDAEAVARAHGMKGVLATGHEWC